MTSICIQTFPTSFKLIHRLDILCAQHQQQHDNNPCIVGNWAYAWDPRKSITAPNNMKYEKVFLI